MTRRLPLATPVCLFHMITKKILIISVSAGAGHVRAGEALLKSAQRKYPGLVAAHIDMLDYVNIAIKKTLVESYALMATQLPELWRFMYQKTNRPQTSWVVRRGSKLLNRGTAGRFLEYITAQQPDQILCTHFLPAHALLEAPAKYRLKIPVSILMTDYDKHDLLTTPGLQHYFVATEKMRYKMRRAGIPSARITVSGIPVDPVFYETKDLAALRSQYQIPKNKTVILILSGGQGLAKLDAIVTTLFGSAKPIHLIAIAGSNQKLRDKLVALRPPAHITFTPVGWTDQIDEYLRLADVIITKPGGLSATECIVLGKPMILISPIPGQEEHNAEYILEHGFGVIARAPDDLLYYVEKELDALAVRVKEKQNKQPIAAQVILNKLST